MKIIFRDVRQAGRYQDSFGTMLVRVEPNETVDKVLEKIKSESNIWYGNKFNKQVSKHIIKNHLGEDVVYTDDEGILLLFDCHDTYTG